MSDLISRQAAINGKILIQRTNGVEVYSDEAVPVEYLKALPSVEPEQKIGHWVYDENGMDWNLPAWVCSECHGRNDMIPTHIRGKDKMIKVEHPLRWAGSKYCPNCGAKMREENGQH